MQRAAGLPEGPSQHHGHQRHDEQAGPERQAGRPAEEPSGHQQLRRYGKEIIGKQFVSKRIADVLIDLFVTACVLSRVTASLEKLGEKGAAHELEIARVFSRAARSRIRGNLHRVDSNDDELVTSLADDALEREGYGWDLMSV